MVSWSFSKGLDYGLNDTWSLAYEFKQKNMISETTAYWILWTILIIVVIGLVVMWWKKKKV
ncbi:hypothetical protein HYW74_01275 [Candidatus Pacearchaeota archaeon]|nr:hypothetical protein [Candidatus Pacearchaeota archaeon]